VAAEQTQIKPTKRLILDANIILRGVFGVRVRSLLETYEDRVAFYSPDVCFDDARKYIPDLAARRGFDPTIGLAVLSQMAGIVEPVDVTLYEVHEKLARARISSRDSGDWPIVATSLLFDCPVWTEDQDFFGSGVATWTTDKVELYLRDSYE
jgi:predicted nucleic acid-binding protein